MGNLKTIEMADAVEEGSISLAQALTYHLQVNHFPPVHPDFFPAIRNAIVQAENGQWSQEIRLPNGKILTAEEIIDQLHLKPFLFRHQPEED